MIVARLGDASLRPSSGWLGQFEGVEAGEKTPGRRCTLIGGEGDLRDAGRGLDRPEGRAPAWRKSALADEVGKIDAKLANVAFVARAPEEVAEEQCERRAQAEQTIARLSAALERLGALVGILHALV